MFRSPNDVTSSDPESSSDEGDGSLAETAQIWAMDEGAADGRHINDVNSGHLPPESPQEPSAVPNLDPSGHSNFILSSLLEHYCQGQAAKVIASEDDGRGHRAADDPDVQALARAMFTRLSGQLHDYGVVEHGYDSPEYGGIRSGYLQGLDYMLHGTMQDGSSQSAGVSSDLSIRPRQGKGMVHSFNGSHSRIQKLIEAAPGNMTQAASLNRQIMGMQLGGHSGLAHGKRSGMPLELRPSNETFLPTSRYSTDFAEVRMLGKGGYGKVFQAVNHLDGQHYAIKKITLSPKRLKKLQDGGQTELEGLLREIRTLARLDHANVVRYFNGWIESSTGLTPVRSARLNTSRLLQDTSIGLFGNPNGDVAAEDDEDDGGILFEDSSVAEGDVKPGPVSQRGRSASHTTTSSTVTKRSTAQSVEEDGDDIEYIPRDFNHVTSGPTSTGNLTEDLVTDTEFGDLVSDRKEASQTGSNLVLHIQMSLHPVNLSSYLFTGEPGRTTPETPHHCHCFHVEPSLRLTLAVLSGVEYLHGQGVVHRDLKPGNVFLTLHHSQPPTTDCVNVTNCSDCPKRAKDCIFVVPRIGDFGLVAQIARPEDLAVEGKEGVAVNDFASPPGQTARPVGTEIYRPAVPMAAIDERLDIFSLGIIAFEMLRRFRTRMERHETLTALNKGHLPNDFSTTIGDESGRVAECIQGMVCPQAEKRWSCRDVRACLEEVLSTFPTT